MFFPPRFPSLSGLGLHVDDEGVLGPSHVDGVLGVHVADDASALALVALALAPVALALVALAAVAVALALVALALALRRAGCHVHV